MKIHKEGHAFLRSTGFFLLLLNAASYLLLKRPQFYAGLLTSTALFGFLASFFRHPKRTTPACKDCVVSPADGRVVNIQRVQENEYFCDERIMISIFLSVFNVHMNWIPSDGKVTYYRYHPGDYLVALHPKSSELNERTTLVIEHPQQQQILVRQIAGLLARRIITYPHVSQKVRRGEELGFIKFGSRVDVFLPLDATLQVSLYQAVKGSETVLATLQQIETPVQ